MIGDIDFIEKYMIETILHQQDIHQLLNEKKLLQTQEVQINTIQASNVDFVVMENTFSGKENSNSETALSKSVKENNLDSETKYVHAIKYKMSKAKERCMTYFQSLHSHLQILSKEDLKGTRIEHGFKREFMSLFESSGIESKVQDESSRSGNDTDTDNANIRLIYDEEPMAEFKPRTSMSNDVWTKRFKRCTTTSTEVPTTHMLIMTSMLEWESLFGPLFDEYFNGENQVVLKSSAITTVDASDKRQQQLDSTSSTSTLATTITADGNFDLYIYLFFSLF
ncbi:hypothetical protein Tco_1484887 [Tanacetum coccineum]